jgi:tRNA-2-methylthio-N6-dimethylallyladenosine synthase
MKRGYTVEEYREMMARIGEIVPDCAVSSDFIVGFCGETEESFQKSMDLVRECRFKNSFIFKYSPRPGTKADELLADDVPEEVKRRRNNEMLKLQNEISEEDHVRLIGRDFEVLVEGLSKSAKKEAARAETATMPESEPSTEPSSIGGAAAAASDCGTVAGDEHPQLVGRTRCDRIVVFDGNPRLVGSLTSVHIYDCTPTTLIGSIVTREYQHGDPTMLPILA